MYQANTVLTGSEMPALNTIGSCANDGRAPKEKSASTAAQRPAARERLPDRILGSSAFLAARRCWCPAPKRRGRLPTRMGLVHARFVVHHGTVMSPCLPS